MHDPYLVMISQCR